ncbi:hypothetical protein Pmani_036332 [Petrolisthes manimaculis]|uniref:Uncharacterized protein n=1 Tax=Petrolisthes manimaculis TaxID=1843537 RepID=A0AAE1NIN0_9EUCA|nr:hypothetical protein Pmani_036332 [Petrolisthes manimaculis]
MLITRAPVMAYQYSITSLLLCIPYCVNKFEMLLHYRRELCVPTSRPQTSLLPPSQVSSQSSSPPPVLPRHRQEQHKFSPPRLTRH